MNRIELHNPLMIPGCRLKTLVGRGVEEGKEGENGERNVLLGFVTGGATFDS
jgi:hypothetical protein